MLYQSLLVCFVVVLIAALVPNRIVWVAWIVACIPGWIALSTGALLHLLQSFVTCLALANWRGKRSTFRWFAVNLLPVICTCTLLGVTRSRQLIRLREKYPYQSLEARLPNRELSAASNTEDEQRFRRDMAQALDCVDPSSARRSADLKELHEKAVIEFVNNPGFGVVRAPEIGPTEWSLRIPEDEERELYPQFGSAPRVNWSTADLLAVDSVRTIGELDYFHATSYLDFVFPNGFGYAKDRKHAAGFVAHGFSRHAPEKASHWRIQRIDLVSLLLHEPPAVYVSDHLPQMKNAKKIPTRPLSFFEQSGLAAIRNGDVLFARRKNEHLFMVGGIRAVKQCTNCHECNDGDLLGAFSYVLRNESEPLDER